MRQKIYRKCSCGETAHDARWDVALKAFVYACRNCGALARDARGDVRMTRLTRHEWTWGIAFSPAVQRELAATFEFAFLRGPAYIVGDVTAYADYRDEHGGHWAGDGSVDVELFVGAWKPVVDIRHLRRKS